MATNFFGAVHTVHAALPHLLERGAAFQNGDGIPYRPAIVNIASIGGKMAVPHMLPYTASKFALTGYSEGLHAELRHKGIRVTTVCPGLMRTGSHVQAAFVGNQPKEHRWFSLAATTPVISASAHYAAGCIYNAVLDGRAEITITPQAWLAARFSGVAPIAAQYLNSLVNQLLLPEPISAEQFSLAFDPRSVSTLRSLNLEEQHNQQPTHPYAPDPHQKSFAFKDTDGDETPWPVPANQPLM
jgi:short-subunit dehydrogenase